MGGEAGEGDATQGRIGLNEFPHDHTHVVGRTVKCFICGHGVPINEAFSAGPDIAMSLYLHEACFRRVGPERAARIYHRQLKGTLLG